MIADTTFLSDLLKERLKGKKGPASLFLEQQRAVHLTTTIISAGELAAMFDESWEAFAWLSKWRIYRLHAGVAQIAADIDRALMARGERLGENDNWIAGFAAYYREPLISRDKGFDRVQGLRRLAY